MADVEFLLDALSRPHLHGEAHRIFAAGVAAGTLSEHQVCLPHTLSASSSRTGSWQHENPKHDLHSI